MNRRAVESAHQLGDAGHVPEGYLLKASVQQCRRRFGFCPDMVVGDLGYISGNGKRDSAEVDARGGAQTKGGMKLLSRSMRGKVRCEQGQTLEWASYDEMTKLIVLARGRYGALPGMLGSQLCPREFWYRADLSETLWDWSS